MSLDITALIIVLIFFIKGYSRGIVAALFSAFALVLGILAALTLSQKLSTYLLEQGWVTSSWVALISYALLFIGVVLGVRWIGRAVEHLLKAVMLGFVNRVVGGVIYGFVALFFVSTIFYFGQQMNLISVSTKLESKTFDLIEPIAPWIFEKAGNWLPLLKSSFEDLQDFFHKVNQHLPEHVGTH